MAGWRNLKRCRALLGCVPEGFARTCCISMERFSIASFLLLPESPLSETALREFDVDPDKVGLSYVSGFRDPLIEQIARTIHAEMIDPKPSGKMLVETLTSALEGSHTETLFQSESGIGTAAGCPRRARPAASPVGEGFHRSPSR